MGVVVGGDVVGLESPGTPQYAGGGWDKPFSESEVVQCLTVIRVGTGHVSSTRRSGR